VTDGATRPRAKIPQASYSKVHPQAEQYRGRANPVGRRSCQVEGKRGAETQLFDYQRQLTMDAGADSTGSVHLPLPSDDPRQRGPDIAPADRALGWTPEAAPEDGLKRTIEHFRRTAQWRLKNRHSRHG
jgi:hypothetical protein